MEFSNIISEFENYFKNIITKFNIKVSEKYDLDIDDLNDIWNNIDNSFEIKVSKGLCNSDTSSKSSTKESKCLYIFCRGSKKGETCGEKVTTGNRYCCKHKKYENQVEPSSKVIDKKSIPNVKSKVIASQNSNDSDDESKPVKKIKLQISLKRHPLTDKYWNEETGLFVENLDNKVFIGKYLDDKILPLSESDIKLCKSKKLKYDITKISDESDIGNIENVLKNIQLGFDNDFDE